MREQRKSNYELLRIIAIIFIISFHYVYKGGFIYETLSVNKMIVNIFTMLGEVGVNLFIFITGYFLIQSKKNISIKKVISLILEIFFYNLLNQLYLNQFDFSNLINNLTYVDFFPFIYNRYWFGTAYILLYIFSPYINRLLLTLSHKENLRLLLTLLIVFCFIPTFFGMKINDTETLLYYNRFIWLIVVYISGALIYLYGNTIKYFNYSCICYFLLAIAFFIIIVGIIFIIEYYHNFFATFGIMNSTYFWRPNTIVTYIWSLLIFLFFSKLKIQNTIINVMASTTFGIYLLHDGVASSILWGSVFKNSTHMYSRYLIFHILLASVIIFVLGCIIDLARQYAIKMTVFLYRRIQKRRI